MKFRRDHIEWGKYKNTVTGKPGYYYYFYFKPNWLEKKHRHLGILDMYYDCQTHRAFGFWYFNVSWSTQWTPIDDDYK